MTTDGNETESYGTEPEVRGTGQFPPDVHCAAIIEICTCLGTEHTTKWDEETGEFKGTRCERHGGHKFQPDVEGVEAVIGALRAEFLHRLLIVPTLTEKAAIRLLDEIITAARAAGPAR